MFLVSFFDFIFNIFLGDTLASINIPFKIMSGFTFSTDSIRNEPTF